MSGRARQGARRRAAAAASSPPPRSRAHLGDCKVVEKIEVEDGLHDAGAELDPGRKVRLRVEAVHPVDNVQRAVGAKRGDVPAGDVLDRLVPLQQDQLRRDGHRLEVDGEGPGDLCAAAAGGRAGGEESAWQRAQKRRGGGGGARRGGQSSALRQRDGRSAHLKRPVADAVPVAKVAIVGEQREHGGGRDGVGPVLEGVVPRLLGGGALEGLDRVQHVDDDAAGQQVDDLHHRVVDAVPVEQQVDVARHKDEQVELLRLARQPHRAALLAQPRQQEEEGGQVRQVAADTENIHPPTSFLSLPRARSVERPKRAAGRSTPQ